jgi:hypothetical protein
MRRREAISGAIKVGEVAEIDADVRVLGAERLFNYREGALQQRLGLGVAALVAIDGSKPVEAAERSRCSGPSALSCMARASL